MEFEILNTIKFGVGVLVAAGIFYKIKDLKWINTSWKLFLLEVVIIAGVSYQQFFTLTEKQDKIKTQHSMLRQGSVNKTLNNYLTEVPVVSTIPTQQQNEQLLKLQQEKSRKLVTQIETTQENNQ